MDHAVFAVYAPTNKKDNGPEVEKFHNALEKQVMAVRTKYGPDTKIIILMPEWAQMEQTILRKNATKRGTSARTGPSASQKQTTIERSYSHFV